ncbi:hypothetical protein ACWEOG_22390 [Amycolatopsis japonica]
MLTFSMPIAITPDQVWIFVQCGDAVISCARLATYLEVPEVVAFPEEFTATNTIVPISKLTGEPMHSLRWATVADLADHPCRFPKADWTA